MFTMGAVLGAAGNQGGPSFEDGEIIAQFYDAGTYYNGTTFEWVASNNSDYKLTDPGASNRPVGVDGSNRLELAGNDWLLMNEALRTALTGLSALTVISGFIRLNNFGNAYAVESIIDGNNGCWLDAWSNGTRAYDERGGVTSVTPNNFNQLLSFAAVKGIFTSGEKSSLQIGSGSIELGSAATGSGAVAISATSKAPYQSNASGSSAFGFIIFIAGAMTPEAWTAFRSTASDNAAYGTVGVTV